MSLPRRLDGLLMKHTCPSCRAVIQREGRWFRTIRQYRCSACRKTVTVTYEDKLRLFAATEKALKAGDGYDPGTAAP